MVLTFPHLRFAFAVLTGFLPNGSSGLPDPHTMVLDLADLPSGWQRKGSRTFRTGLMAPTAPWAKRQRAARATSVVVSYGPRTDPWVMVMSQAVPLVTTADAVEAFPTMQDRFLSNPDPLVTETRRTALDPTIRLGDQCAALLLEATNLGEPGSQGEQFLAFWRRGSVLAFLSVGGRVGHFNTDDLFALALQQDRRIGAALEAWQTTR